jgi:hypothetical protein
MGGPRCHTCLKCPGLPMFMNQTRCLDTKVETTWTETIKIAHFQTPFTNWQVMFVSIQLLGRLHKHVKGPCVNIKSNKLEVTNSEQGTIKEITWPKTLSHGPFWTQTMGVKIYLGHRYFMKLFCHPGSPTKCLDTLNETECQYHKLSPADCATHPSERPQSGTHLTNMTKTWPIWLSIPANSLK